MPDEEKASRLATPGQTSVMIDSRPFKQEIRPSNQEGENEGSIGDHSQQDADPESERKAFQVRFEPGDPESPLNFSSSKKISILVQMALLALVGSMGTSITAPAQPDIAKYTHTSAEATTLTMSLYLLGKKPLFCLSAW